MSENCKYQPANVTPSVLLLKPGYSTQPRKPIWKELLEGLWTVVWTSLKIYNPQQNVKMILVREWPRKTFMGIEKGAQGNLPLKMLALENVSRSLCSRSWSSTVLGGAVLLAYFCHTRVPTRTSLRPGHRTAEAFDLPWLNYSTPTLVCFYPVTTTDVLY